MVGLVELHLWGSLRFCGGKGVDVGRNVVFNGIECGIRGAPCFGDFVDGETIEPGVARDRVLECASTCGNQSNLLELAGIGYL